MKKIEINAGFNPDEIKQARIKLEQSKDVSDYDYAEIENEKYSYNCRKCGRGKYVYVTYFKEFMPAKCQCEMDEKRKEEEKEQLHLEEMRFRRRQRYIAVGYRDIYLSNSDTKLDKVENFINNFEKFKEKNKGLMIYGQVGNGKTFIASCIANELCKRGYLVAMYHISEALQEIGKFDNENFVQLVQSADLLIIDDFGASRNTQYKVEQLVNLIDTRYAVKKPIVITSNLDRKELIEDVDIGLERTYNRLIEMTHPMHIEAPNRRIKKAKDEYAEFESLLNGK